MFNNLTTDGLEKQEDRVGGGFQPKESDIYTGKIKAAYAGKSQGGAMNVSLIVDLGGTEYRETIYITNKKGENWFTKDGKKIPLPGFTTINDICLIATGDPLANQETEEKVIQLYDYEAKKELPTKVDMLTGLIGEEIAVGILKQLEDKNAKNDATGEYEPTGETRETNVIDKVFHPEAKMTVVEAMNGAEEPKFWDAWVEKNKGTVRDKTSKTAKASGGKPVPRPQAGNTPAGGKSLFPKK